MMRLLLPLLLCFLLTGCATIIQGRTQKLLITSDPPGAVVSVDGVPVGTTPVVAKVARKRPHTLSAALDGHPDDSLTIVPKSNYNLLALSLFFYLGFPVDLINGAHRSFPESQIRFQFATRESVAQGEIQSAPSPAPPVPIGARIRVRYTELASPVVTVGTLRAFSPDTLHVESGPPSAMLHRIPLSSASSIELSVGSVRVQSAARSAWRGALYGWAAGAVVGGLIYGLEGAYWFSFLYGLPGGTIVGALLGTAASTTDRWMNVPCCATAPATPPGANAQAQPAHSATTNRP